MGHSLTTASVQNIDTPAARREFSQRSQYGVRNCHCAHASKLRAILLLSTFPNCHVIQTTDDKSFVTPLDAKLNQKNNHHFFDRRLPNGLGRIRPRPLPTGRQCAPIRAPRSTTDQICSRPLFLGPPSCTVLVTYRTRWRHLDSCFNSVRSIIMELKKIVGSPHSVPIPLSPV
jgi:hypothetical protein